VPEYLATDLHDHVFIECIRGQASEEQAARILPLAMRKVIIGAYAQTELAHGSNVMGLQTTFTFIRETDEFEVHTPSLEAIKWWPGCMVSEQRLSETSIAWPFA
jgi:acyl-CoA oxidase